MSSYRNSASFMVASLEVMFLSKLEEAPLAPPPPPPSSHVWWWWWSWPPRGGGCEEEKPKVADIMTKKLDLNFDALCWFPSFPSPPMSKPCLVCFSGWNQTLGFDLGMPLPYKCKMRDKGELMKVAKRVAMFNQQGDILIFGTIEWT